MTSASLIVPPPELLADLAACGGGSVRHSREARPGTRGAYALLLPLKDRVPLDSARFPATVLEPGWYVYAGSAYGPGGIEARVARHLRAEKRPHWHIDRLTSRVRPWVTAIPGGQECAVIRELSRQGHFTGAVAGFGSSDCRSCLSHLMRWTPS